MVRESPFIRVYGLRQVLMEVADGRHDPTIPLPSLLWKLLGGITIGLPSLNQLEEAIRDGDFDRLGGRVRPSADTFGYALTRLDLPSVTRVNDQVIEKARRNKALDETRVCGWKVVAFDGSGLFSTRSARLGRHAYARRGVHGEKLPESIYLEQVCGVSYVSDKGPNLLLDLVRIPPGKGEMTVARQMMRDLFARHCRDADIVPMDANFAKAPILNELLAQRKHFVVRVKQENYDIIQDADRLFAGRAPTECHQNVRLRDDERRVRFDLEVWEDEGFTSWEQVDQPPRCLKVRETRKEVNAGGKVIRQERIETHFVTSCPRAVVHDLEDCAPTMGH